MFEQKNETFKLASKELSSLERVSNSLLQVTFYYIYVYIFFTLLKFAKLISRGD